MKQQEILKKISHILHELNEQFDYLQTAETNLNDLELELFAANAKFLTDHTEILRKINLQNQHTVISLPEHTESQESSFVHTTVPILIEEPVQPIEEAPLPPLSEKALAFDSYVPPEDEPAPSAPAFIKEPVNEVIIADEPESTEPAPEINIEPATTQDTFGFVRTAPDVSSNQHTFGISSTHTEEEKPPHVNLNEEIIPQEGVFSFSTAIQHADKQPEPEIKHEPVQEFKTHELSAEPAATPVTPHINTEPVIPPIAEQPKAEPEQPLTLNQRLSAQLQQQQPAQSAGYNSPAAVTDIKSAINLNDKMLFVKDLFNGYSLAYSEAVELLNRCKNFDEADRFLRSNYVSKNNWAAKPDTVDKFYMILHRRFSA